MPRAASPAPRLTAAETRAASDELMSTVLGTTPALWPPSPPPLGLNLVQDAYVATSWDVLASGGDGCGFDEANQVRYALVGRAGSVGVRACSGRTWESGAHLSGQVGPPGPRPTVAPRHLPAP